MPVHVSIHDVSPAWKDEVEAALAMCHGAGAKPALLVVPNYHARAPLHGRIDPDEAAVGLDEGLGDGEPEPGPTTTAVLAEHLEHVLPLLGGDPGPVVAHRDLDEGGVGVRLRACRQADDAAGGRHPLRVLQEIGQDLTDAAAADFHRPRRE